MSITTDYKPEVSVIVPMYREASRAELLRRTAFGLHCILDREFRGAYELIAVNDGSTDGSDIIAGATGMRVIDAHPSGLNHGKGTAVLTGLNEAAGNIRLFTDADGSYVLRGDGYDGSTVLRLIEAVKNGNHIAVARRVDSVKAHDGKSRSFYHSLSRSLELIAPTGVSDPQAGAKAFSASAIEYSCKPIPHEHQGFGTDRTILHLARILDLKVAEIDAEIEVADGSHVRPLPVGGQLIWQAFEARRLGKEL